MGIVQAQHLGTDVLASVLDIITDAVIAIDEDQRILFFNHGAEHIFGYQAEEVLGRPLDLLLPSRLSQAHRRHVRSFAAGPEIARLMGKRQEIFGRRKDGTEFPAEASISKLVRSGQTVFTAILRDVTERKRAEEALRHAHEELELRVEARTAALAQANQALRRQNELYQALLQAQSDLGEGVALADGPTQRILYVNEAQCRLYGYTEEEFLNLSSPFALIAPEEQAALQERFRLKREPINLVALVREAAAQTQILSEKHPISIHTNGQRLVTLADRERLLQVLANLLENGIKYSPGGGPIQITLSQENGHAIVSVKDRGIGIPADRLSQLFQRFYRAHNVSSRHYGGLGLGLYICREIVERHGGQIWADSREGDGSVFSFSIPLAESGGDHTVSDRKSDAPPEDHSGG